MVSSSSLPFFPLFHFVRSFVGAQSGSSVAQAQMAARVASFNEIENTPWPLTVPRQRNVARNAPKIRSKKRFKLHGNKRLTTRATTGRNGNKEVMQHANVFVLNVCEMP